MLYYHIIVDLDIGGAEKMLLNLLKNIKNPKNHIVLSLKSKGELLSAFEAVGVEVVELGMTKSPIEVVQVLKKLNKIIKSDTTIISWMYHSIAIGLLFKLFKNNVRLIGNIRHSDVGLANNKFSTYIIIRIIGFLSSFIDTIIYNGYRAQNNHNSIGYLPKNEIVIGNGIDFSSFKIHIDKQKYTKWHNRKKRLLTVSRFNKIKGIDVLIEALSMIKNELGFNSFEMIFIGRALDTENMELTNLIKKNNLTENVTLLGIQDDIQDYYKEADVFVLPSISEAFPNALIEAMSAGLICVSTAVGDASKLLEHSFLVNAGDKTALANKILEVLRLPDVLAVGVAETNREIIRKNYDIKKIVKIYECIFENN